MRSGRKPIETSTKKKKNEYLEKNRNSILFCVFLEIKFSRKKVLFHTHISGMVRGIELKFFSHILDTILRGYFFLFQKILLWGFLAAVTTFALVKKQAFFRVCPVFWLFFSNDKRYKGKKKYTHPKLFPVSVKKFSARSDIVSRRGGCEK